MYYEINVCYNGRHYFATAERSLTDQAAAELMFNDFEKRFPASEGFELTMDRLEKVGRTIRRRTK